MINTYHTLFAVVIAHSACPTDIADFDTCSKTIMSVVSLCVGGVPQKDIRPYFYMKGALAHDETYTVSRKDIYSKIFAGGGTSLFVAQGDFAFVENHLCVDSPKYIETNAKGEKQLTDYARTHMDERCIKFKCKSSDEFLRTYAMIYE